MRSILRQFGGRRFGWTKLGLGLICLIALAGTITAFKANAAAVTGGDKIVVTVTVPQADSSIVPIGDSGLTAQTISTIAKTAVVGGEFTDTARTDTATTIPTTPKIDQ